MGSNKKRKVPFTKAQQRITRSGIEPGFSNLLLTNPTLYQLIYRRRIFELIVDLEGLASFIETVECASIPEGVKQKTIKLVIIVSPLDELKRTEYWSLHHVR